MELKEIMELFGRNVTKYRELKGMSLTELSKRTKIRAEYLKRIESGTAQRIKLEYFILLSNALKVSTKKLFEE